MTFLDENILFQFNGNRYDDLILFEDSHKNKSFYFYNKNIYTDSSYLFIQKASSNLNGSYHIFTSPIEAIHTYLNQKDNRANYIIVGSDVKNLQNQIFSFSKKPKIYFYFNQYNYFHLIQIYFHLIGIEKFEYHINQNQLLEINFKPNNKSIIDFNPSINIINDAFKIRTDSLINSFNYKVNSINLSNIKNKYI